MVKIKVELKSPLLGVKEESEKAGLKLNIQKMKIMASIPITSWQIQGEKWKQMVTASVKLEDACFFEKKAMTNIDSVLKNRDITLPINILRVKATVFPVVMYGCKTWTIKKVEH